MFIMFFCSLQIPVYGKPSSQKWEAMPRTDVTSGEGRAVFCIIPDHPAIILGNPPGNRTGLSGTPTKGREDKRKKKKGKKRKIIWLSQRKAIAMATSDDLKSHAASTHDFYALLDLSPAAVDTEI